MRRTARIHANPLRPASAASAPASSAKNHGEPPWAEKPTANRGKKRAPPSGGQSAGSAGTTPPLFLGGAANAYDGASEIRQAWTRGRKRRAARHLLVYGQIVGCFKNSHSATVCNSTSSLPAAWRTAKGPEKYPPGLLHASCPPCLFQHFPSAGRPRRHTAFIITHCGAVQKESASRFPIVPDSRLASGKRGQRGTPALTVLPIRHIAAFPCIGEDTGEELPIRSALVFVRKNIRAHIGKAGFSDKMPIHGLPFPNRRKRNAVSGPGDQFALPGKQKKLLQIACIPLRLAFPYARCGPPSSATKLPAQKTASLTQCSSLVRTIRRLYPLGDTRLTVPLRTSWHAKVLPKERLLSFNCPFPSGNGTSRHPPA